MGAGSRVIRYEFGQPVWERTENRELQSPYHVKGMRSPSVFGGHIRRKLTDKAIERYAKQGYYGMVEQWSRIERTK